MQILSPEILDYINGICCPTPVVTYNFDVTADWHLMRNANGVVTPVTDKNSFITWLSSGADPNDEIYNSFNQIVVTDFVMLGNNIKCNLSANGNGFSYALCNANISNANKIGNIYNISVLDLRNNNLTEFNPNTTLPSSLQTLDLSTNEIVTFNPTLALPSSLQFLYLSNNQVVNFNPSLALPSSLLNLYLENNQMTTSGYSNSETWANAQPAFTNDCNVYFSNNTNSVANTTLANILVSKNCTVNA